MFLHRIQHGFQHLQARQAGQQRNHGDELILAVAEGGVDGIDEFLDQQDAPGRQQGRYESPADV